MAVYGEPATFTVSLFASPDSSRARTYPENLNFAWLVEVVRERLDLLGASPRARATTARASRQPCRPKRNALILGMHGRCERKCGTQGDDPCDPSRLRHHDPPKRVGCGFSRAAGPSCGGRRATGAALRRRSFRTAHPPQRARRPRAVVTAGAGVEGRMGDVDAEQLAVAGELSDLFEHLLAGGERRAAGGARRRWLRWRSWNTSAGEKRCGE